MATGALLTGKRQKRYRRFVDMWIAPGIHPTNIDLLNKLKSADDRQFSSNMSVTGKVYDEDRESKTNGESHIIGIRTDIWRPSTKERKKVLDNLQRKRATEVRKEINRSGQLTSAQKLELEQRLAEEDAMFLKAGDIDKSRLVVKMFRSTGKRIHWKGTLEEMTMLEIHNSIGSKRALATYTVILAEYDYLITIQQNNRFMRIPPVFSFSYYDEANDRIWYVDLKAYWVSLGIDYSVEAQGKVIGKIDGKFLALGNDSKIHIYEPCLAEDTKFLDILTLFASCTGFQRRVRNNIKNRVKNLVKGRMTHFVDPEELWLQKNPRRIR